MSAVYSKMSEDSSDAETISVEYRESDEESMQVDEQDEETLTESSDAMGPYYEKGEKVFVVLKDKRTSKKGSIHLLPIQPAKVLDVITKKSKTTKGDARPKYSYEVELFETISFTTAIKKGKFEEELLLDMNDDHKKRFDDQEKQKSVPAKKQQTPAKKQSRGSLSKNTSKGSQTSPAYANRLLSFKNEAYMQKPVSQSRKPLKNLKQMIAMEDVSNLPSDTPTCKLFICITYCHRFQYHCSPFHPPGKEIL